MIVVIGNLVAGAGGDRDGRTAAGSVAERIAAAGSAVEVVGVVPGDGGGDRVLQALSGVGVGHAAVLRSPADGLEPADLELALRYLPDIAVIVVVEAAADIVETAAAAAAWSDASLIVVAGSAGSPSGATPGAGTEVRSEVADRTVVLAAPARDPDGAFAGVVGALAGRLAGGAKPADAWADTATALGLEAVRPSSAV